MKKLKFLQIHKFYTRYLNQFYQNHPKLINESFNTQTNTLLSDGFSGIHLFSPYMKKLNYDAQFVVVNNIHSQQKWLSENNCLSINPKDPNYIYATTKYQIDKFQPDILYITIPTDFDSQFIRTLSWKPSLIIGWRAASIYESTDWSEFDIMLSSLSNLRDVAIKLGAKHVEHFFPGFPIHIHDIVKHIFPIYDVGFTGTWSEAQHLRRNYLLNHIAENAKADSFPFSCGFYLSGQLDRLTSKVAKHHLGSRFGLSMYQSIRSAKIIFDARASHELINSYGKPGIDLAGSETANMRIFEVTGCGSFLLTEHFENLNNFFEIGKEIETFHNEKDLIDKIRYYLEHPEQREIIAQKGKERCLKQYSMENRAIEFDRIIRKYLVTKTESPSKK